MKNVYEIGESDVPAHYVQKWLGSRWCWVPPQTAEPSSAPPIIAPTPSQQAAAWAITQPPKEPHDAKMQRLRSDLLNCVTLAGDLLEPVPRRVVAHRVFATTPDDGELCFGWQDGDAPGALSTAAAAAAGWRIERAYSE